DSEHQVLRGQQGSRDHASGEPYDLPRATGAVVHVSAGEGAVGSDAGRAEADFGVLRRVLRSGGGESGAGVSGFAGCRYSEGSDTDSLHAWAVRFGVPVAGSDREGRCVVPQGGGGGER